MLVVILGITAVYVPAIYPAPTDEGTRRTNTRDNESVYLMPACVWRAFQHAHLHDAVMALCRNWP
jgi:hypothetical protein